MLHGITIKSCDKDDLHIDFQVQGIISDYKEASAKAQQSLFTMLMMLGLTPGDEKNKNDFRFIKNPYNDKLPVADLHIYGKPNIITLLKFLLENPIREKLFKFKDYNEKDVMTRWKKELDMLYIQCMDDKTIPKGEYEKVIPHIKSYLDTKYSELCNEELVIAMKNKAQTNYGDDVLKHPFYQTLSLLLTDYDDRKREHANCPGIFKDIKKPSGTKYNEVITEFLPLVPLAYRGKGHIGSKSIEIDNDKIKKSREELPQAHPTLLQSLPTPILPMANSMTKK